MVCSQLEDLVRIALSVKLVTEYVPRLSKVVTLLGKSDEHELTACMANVRIGQIGLKSPRSFNEVRG